MDVFPIGSISASNSQGTIDSISYDQFEPNSGCRSYPIFNNLVTTFQSQTILTRKTAEPYLTLEYTYDNIFAREYRQIEHFIRKKEDSLNSFYVVDWYNGISPSNITNSGGDWVVSIDDTRLYSTISNQKANRAFVWDGSNWKEGTILSLIANTSVTVDVDTNNYGALTLANAQANGMIYPLYQCFLIPQSLQNFKSGDFVPKENIDTSNDGGYMVSGSISFISKYKV